MKLTILGSGGCMAIPKPFCRCRVCREAREKGVPYARGGPAAYLHDANLLVDTPADIIGLLNRTSINRIDNLLFSHLDPDHVEGFRVVEQIALDFRTWRAYPEKQIRLLLPEQLGERLRAISSQYGPQVDFYRGSGFIRQELFRDKTEVGDVLITAIPVDRGPQVAFVHVFEKAGRRVVYAPCDIKPFPKHRDEVQQPDLLVIQPGIFEDGLKHGFRYPDEHISRQTLYTFGQTMELVRDLEAQNVVFVHLEEYWNRSHDDYLALEADNAGIRFAYDGMPVKI
ncbi:MBL fold metallo-hydrolase [Chloroflexota bacterium]